MDIRYIVNYMFYYSFFMQQYLLFEDCLYYNDIIVYNYKNNF